MENKLNAKIELLEALIAFMDQGIIAYDKDLTIVASNSHAANLRDIPAEMLEVGKSFEDIIKFFSERGDYGPGELSDLIRKNLALARMGHPNKFERRRPDGSIVEVRSNPMPGGATVVTFMDITEQKDAEEAVVKSKQSLDLMLENIVDGLIAIEESGVVRVFNATAQRIFGYSRAEVVGNNISMLMPEPDHSRHSSYLRAYHRTGQAKIIGVGREVVGRRKDGSEFPLDLEIGEVTVGEQRIYIGTLRNISDKKTMEEQLRQSQKMESLGTLAGGIAHDFNNLLTSIIGYTKLTKKQLDADDTCQSYLDRVLDAGKQAADLVEQIMTFSRVDKRKRRPLLMCHVVNKALKLIRRTLPANLILEENVEENAGVVRLNETEIHQVVINLASNAADAMGNNGTLSVALGSVEVDTGRPEKLPNLKEGTYLRLSVRYTGCGMDDATRQRIFDPFFTTKEVGKGTGLGLSVVHGIVSAHDGTMVVTSEPGEGTHFELFFPCVDLPAMNQAEEQDKGDSEQVGEAEYAREPA